MKQHTEPNEATTGGAAAEKPDGEGPRSFSVFMRTLSDGEAESQASYELHELGKRLQEIASLTRNKAKGKLKVTITLVAEVNNTVAVFYDINVVQPKRPTTPALFWMTKGGNLSATDTRQLELRPREVPSRREVREIPAPDNTPPKEA